jgi:hypothetical protein
MTEGSPPRNIIRGAKNAPRKAAATTTQEGWASPALTKERENREESFMPVEITGAWVRAEKGIGGRIVLGWFAPGLKPRPPKEKNGVE